MFLNIIVLLLFSAPSPPDVEEPRDFNGVADFHTGQLSSDFLDVKPTKASKHANNNNINQDR